MSQRTRNVVHFLHISFFYSDGLYNWRSCSFFKIILFYSYSMRHSLNREILIFPSSLLLLCWFLVLFLCKWDANGEKQFVSPLILSNIFVSGNKVFVYLFLFRWLKEQNLIVMRGEKIHRSGRIGLFFFRRVAVVIPNTAVAIVT